MAYLVNTADLVGMIQDFRRGLGLDHRRVIPLDNRPSLAIMKRKQQQIRSEGTPFSNDDQQNFWSEIMSFTPFRKTINTLWRMLEELIDTWACTIVIDLTDFHIFMNF